MLSPLDVFEARSRCWVRMAQDAEEGHLVLKHDGRSSADLATRTQMSSEKPSNHAISN